MRRELFQELRQAQQGPAQVCWRWAGELCKALLKIEGMLRRGIREQEPFQCGPYLVCGPSRDESWPRANCARVVFQYGPMTVAW